MKLFKKTDIILLSILSVVLYYSRAYLVSADRSFDRLPPINRALSIPVGTPKPSQENIEIAMQVFNIRLPANSDIPQYSPESDGENRAVQWPEMGRCRVEVYKEAFETWGILGSTLAHEVEVHCRQSVVVMGLMKTLFIDYSPIIERTAYDYEIENADRFGLTRRQVDGIRGARDFFYPNK